MPIRASVEGFLKTFTTGCYAVGVCVRAVDRAIQAHGGMGLTDEVGLVHAYDTRRVINGVLARVTKAAVATEVEVLCTALPRARTRSAAATARSARPPLSLAVLPHAGLRLVHPNVILVA